MKKLPLLALLVLAACYATAEPMYLPDGSQGYRISCDHYLGSITDCLQKAGDMCGANGYQVYDPSGHLKSEESQNQAVIAALNSDTNASKNKMSPETPKNMFIKCRSMDMPMRLAPAPNPQVDSNPVMLQTPQLAPSIANPAPAQKR
jgi:hypothetical protein